MVKRRRVAPHVSRKRRKRTGGRRLRITTLIPKTKAVKLVYVGTANIGSMVTGNVGHLVTCNGMFDPDFTGLGHQPMGFDQWMGFYNHYRVFKSKLTCWVNGSSNDVTQPLYLVLRTDDNSSIVSPIASSNRLEQAVEEPGTRVKLFGNAQSDITKAHLTKTWNARSTFGKSFADNDMKGNVGSNPAELSFFRMQIFNADTGDTDTTRVIMWKVTYWAMLTERKDIGQS